MPSATIDVRPIEPKDKHVKIFELLGKLAAGDKLTLVNDHDPIPLKYQIEAEYPDQYTFNYVESGPVDWIVDITCRAHIIDARPAIAAGGEPFGDIMAAAGNVKDGEVLVVYAPFEPVPLEGVLGEHGFTHRADELAPNNWRTIFSK
ncbi:MAG: DUF2249 domain-containing protein [Armatimonadetes bacterium]|nr:MAG: DUF2249 domain-containing protein [Armatimonadota bacterium]